MMQEFQIMTPSVSRILHLYIIYNMFVTPLYDMVPSKWERANRGQSVVGSVAAGVSCSRCLALKLSSIMLSEV